tara:strand:- start:346 stop:531 length:186 start_codon:yes stop_codon:yes gene_type:complete
MNNIKYLSSPFFIILVNIFSVVYAQPSFPNEPTQTPIGGLGVLAAAGGAMVVKKIINNRKK